MSKTDTIEDTFRTVAADYFGELGGRGFNALLDLVKDGFGPKVTYEIFYDFLDEVIEPYLDEVKEPWSALQENDKKDIAFHAIPAFLAFCVLALRDDQIKMALDAAKSNELKSTDGIFKQIYKKIMRL